MGNFQQKHVFLKGMNLDADPRYIEDGDYGEAWNIIINNKVGGSAGTAENIKGNLVHDYTVATSLGTPKYVPSSYASALTSGATAYRYESPFTTSIVSWLDDKCIGWCGDVQNNAIYFFVCRLSSNASTGAWAASKYMDHHCPRIFKYDITNSVLTLIYDRIALNFKPLLPVQAKFVNNSLYFCNGVEWNSSELKHLDLNIPRHLLPEIDGGYEDDIDVSWAKCPPKSPPVWVLQYNSSRAGQLNNIKGKTFQFASRFVYYSGEKSVWSSFSVGCPVYPKEQDPSLVPTDYNEISIANDNYGNSTNFSTYGKIISYVEYAARETSYSQWKLIKRVPYQTNVTLINSPTASFNCIVVDGINHTNVIKFYNDEAYPVIADEEILKPFDAIPQKAKSLESVQGRMHVANNIEDFPTLIDTSFNNTSYNLSLDQDDVVTSLNTLLSAGFATPTPTQAVKNNVRVLKTNSTYSVAIQFSDRASRKTYAYTSEKLTIKTQRQKAALTLTDYATGLTLNGLSFPDWVTDQFTHFSILMSENKDVSFYLQVAIEHAYYVGGRDINGTPRFTKRIGNQYDLTTTPSDDYVKTWEAANQYQLSQIYLDQFNYTAKPNTQADYSQASEVWIDISNLLRYNNNVPYVFTQGDRLRLLTLGTDTNADNEFDYAIKEQNGRFLVIESELSEVNGVDTFDKGTGGARIRLTVCVTKKGEIFFTKSDSSPYQQAIKLPVSFNKVAIQQLNVADPIVVAVGDNGKMYQSKYSTIMVWDEVITGTTKNINNICWSDQTGVGANKTFFFCGDRGLVGVVDGVGFSVNIYDTQTAAAGIDSSWKLVGIDVLPMSEWAGVLGTSIFISISCYTNSSGRCANVMAIFDKPTGTIVFYPKNTDSLAINYNDCSILLSNEANTINIVQAGLGSDGYGEIDVWAFNPVSLDHEFAKNLEKAQSDKFAEITACTKTKFGVVSSVSYGLSLYFATSNGQVLVRGVGKVDVSGASKFYPRVSKSQSFSTATNKYEDPIVYGYPLSNINTPYDNLDDVITARDRFNLGQPNSETITIGAVSTLNGGNRLLDVSMAIGSLIGGLNPLQAVGQFLGVNNIPNIGIGGSPKTEGIIVPFETTIPYPVLNYGALIEIYRPKALKSQIYYESILGSSFFDNTNKYYQTSRKRVYPILQNLNDPIGQYTTTSTTLLGDEGDSYCLKKTYKGRLWNKSYDIISMTPDVSNITGSYINSQDVSTPFGWQKTNGKPNLKAIFTEAISFKKTGHRFSEQYLPNSKINGLSQFEGGSEKIFPQEYIEINKLIVASDNKINGSILLSLFTSNSISIYINRSQITDGSGDRQVGLSDQVLGSFNTLDGGYGCVHPESVSAFNQKVWWWDANKGIIVRYSRDGVTPLSDIYKVRSYIRPKAISLASQYANPAYSQLAPGTYDFFNDIYILCLREYIYPFMKGESIVFDEELDSFISKYDISNSLGETPELMANVYNKTFSFMNGLIHIHNVGEYNTFYGHKKESTIEVITNKFPSDVKEFANISLESADKWSIPKQITSIYNKKIKQLSGLDLTDYVTEEGIYKSDLRKDINTVDRFVTKTGTITTSTTTTTITGVGTLFTTQLKVGYAIFASNTYIGAVKTLTSNTSLELEEKSTATVSGVAYMSAPIPAGYTESDSINVGDKLRGNYMITKLKLDPNITTKSQIFAVNIEFNASDPLISKQ